MINMTLSEDLRATKRPWKRINLIYDLFLKLSCRCYGVILRFETGLFKRQFLLWLVYPTVRLQTVRLQTVRLHDWKPITVNSRLADTSLLRTPRCYGQQLNPRRKLQTFDWNKLPLLRTLAITDLRTLYSVPMSQFYCFLSRYSGHPATSWNICVHIKSI